MRGGDRPARGAAKRWGRVGTSVGGRVLRKDGGEAEPIEVDAAAGDGEVEVVDSGDGVGAGGLAAGREGFAARASVGNGAVSAVSASSTVNGGLAAPRAAATTRPISSLASAASSSTRSTAPVRERHVEAAPSASMISIGNAAPAAACRNRSRCSLEGETTIACKESRSSIRRFLRTPLIVQRNAGSRDGVSRVGGTPAQRQGFSVRLPLRSRRRSEHLRRRGRNLSFARMPGKLLA